MNKNRYIGQLIPGTWGQSQLLFRRKGVIDRKHMMSHGSWYSTYILICTYSGDIEAGK